MRPHTCKEVIYCRCYLLADEPNDDCPIHGFGTWPPKCGTCGRFLKRKTQEAIMSETRHVCGLQGYCPGPPHYDPICPACRADELTALGHKDNVDCSCDFCEDFRAGVRPSLCGKRDSK